MLCKYIVHAISSWSCLASMQSILMKLSSRALKISTGLQGIPYGRNRVFNNYSGNRPAEPSSVAAVAVWHTLTRLLLQLVYIVREACPEGRLLLPWEVKAQADAASAKGHVADTNSSSRASSTNSSPAQVRVGLQSSILYYTSACDHNQKCHAMPCHAMPCHTMLFLIMCIRSVGSISLGGP